ncbi:hypothetical protein [Rhodococcus sp. NPDC003348]
MRTRFRTAARSVAAAENVNVVPSVGGAHTHTDRQAADPVTGRPAYETFLTRELPRPIDCAHGGNAVACAQLLADPPMETGVSGEFDSLVCPATTGSVLAGQGIAHTMNLRPVGTHKWGYRNDELRSSRPVLPGSLR